MTRRLAAQALVLLALAAGGCGSDKPAAQPMAVVGAYTVHIEANGRTDMDVMTIVAGSTGQVLLEFAAGISQVRALLYGATELELLRQALKVSHSTGAAQGTATGGGTIAGDGSADITIHLATAGLATDAGDSGAVDYHITGMKQ